VIVVVIVRMMLTGMILLADSEAVVSRWTPGVGSEIASDVDLRTQLVLERGGFEDWQFEIAAAVKDRHSISHPSRHRVVPVAQVLGRKYYCLVGTMLGWQPCGVVKLAFLDLEEAIVGMSVLSLRSRLSKRSRCASYLRCLGHLPPRLT
jgi:hypothetical protein